MANCKRAYQIDGSELPRYAELYEHGREAQRMVASKVGRTTGPVNGRKNVENGNLARARASADLSKGGRMAGRLAAESGRIQKLGRLWGRKNLVITPESCAKGGRIGGLKNSKNGQIQALGRAQGRKNSEVPGFFARLGRSGGPNGGKTQGRNNAESGHIQSVGRAQGRKNVESGHLAKVRASALHVRWHANRNTTNHNCAYCLPE